MQEDFNSSVNTDDFTATYVFDLTGNRLQKLTDAGRDATVDQTITYKYDANDRLQTEEQDDASTTTTVDQQITYDYDHTTQTGKTTTIPGLVVDNTQTWNITSQVTYAYNVQGQLASAVISEYGNSSESPGSQGSEIKRMIASYTYDDTGIRITATECILTDSDNDPETELTETSFTSTEYLNDPDNLTGYSQVLQETQRDTAQQIIKTIISTLA